MSIQPKGKIQAYSAGAKTYGFGRSNATSGPVDPLGYRERDAKPMTTPGAIQRRMTGGAPAPRPAAPSPMDFSNAGQAARAAVSPTGHVSNFVSNPAIQAPPMNGTTTAQPTPGAETGGGNFAPIPGEHSPAGYGPPSNYMDPAGPPGMQSGGIPVQHTMADLPNDPAYQSHLANINAAAARHHAQIGQQQHDIEGNAFQTQRQIEQQAPKLYEDTTNNFAARGLAYSGRHELDQGEAHNQVATQLNDVQQQKTQALNSLQNNDLDFQGQQQSELTQAQQDFIHNLSGQAGQLGLDRQTQDPTPPDYAGQLQALLANYGKGMAGSNAPVNPSLVSSGLGVGKAKPRPVSRSPITSGPKAPTPIKQGTSAPIKRAVPSPISTRAVAPVAKAPVRRVPSNIGRRK